jgi:hypothetical protein
MVHFQPYQRVYPQPIIGVIQTYSDGMQRDMPELWMEAFMGTSMNWWISRKPWLIEGYWGYVHWYVSTFAKGSSDGLIISIFCVPKNQTHLALVSYTEATKNPKQAVLNRCSVNILGTSHPQSAIVCWKKARFGVSSLFCDLGMCKHYLLHKWKVKTVMILTNLAWCFHKISTCIVTSYWSVCMCRYAQKTTFHKMIASTARQSVTTCWCHELVVVFLHNVS